VKRPDRRRACVLVFHRVTDRVERPHDIRWSTFRRILDVVAGSGGSVATQLEPETLRQASAVLTFDDGTGEHLELGRELAGRGMPGLFFISTGKVGEPGYVGPADVREMASLGHVVGSHGVRHEPLNLLPRPGVLQEVRASKQMLEELIGSEVRYFAPPGGVEAPSLTDSLLQCGYAASRSMRWGVHSPAASRWAVPVVPVTEFTFASGWIGVALREGRLPLTMRSLGAAKSLVSPRIRATLSRLAHRPERRSLMEDRR
jgi:hypothetical protein